MHSRGLYVLGLFALSLLLIAPAASARKKKRPCSFDGDCVGGGVCYEGTCKKLKPTESLLRVELSAQINGTASLFIDEAFMGEVPWEGIIPSGYHAIRVEAMGYMTANFKGNSRGGVVDTLRVEMKVVPPQEPQVPFWETPSQNTNQPQQQPEADGDHPVPGTLFFALYGGGGYGTASWGPDGKKRPASGLQMGGAFGLRAVTDPVWLDLGFALSSSTYMVKEWVGWGEMIKLNFGLLARLLFPVKENLFYVGAEIEPGYGLSSKRYGYIQAHLAFSIIPNRFIEIRLNPLGMEYLQELEFKGFIASFHATLGLAVRFPKNPLF